MEEIKTKSRKSTQSVRVKQSHIPDIIIDGQHRNIRRKAVSPSRACDTYTVKNISAEKACLRNHINRDGYLSNRNLVYQSETYYNI
ncbi:MAG: hypothetical protein NTU73_10065, partial [Ignavibacteriae bacterium]|nr:hypothetical protein [Ignavibacteriota bacterium]